ncbi:hypothetical protein [Streptomyces sp. NPDC008240]|uniref:hypothetical protein n=1 Tax=Streptomyces sp. NPDC008240 TaxID=3364822 RepID=UPI0036E9C2EC
MPHAQVYAQCQRLLAAGLLAQVRQESGRNRRVLTLTDGGRRALRQWLSDPGFVPVEARERGILKLWFGARPELLAPVQLAEHETALGEYEARRLVLRTRPQPGRHGGRPADRRSERPFPAEGGCHRRPGGGQRLARN